MATFTGYIAEVMEGKIRVAPTLEAEPFDGILFHIEKHMLDVELLFVGQQVRVEYAEQMTRSLPPQAAAHRIDVL
ncbi:DUF3221 domain-containing protein [Exiguobacterium qingdaonense]|uniref:DUF3221 domain-containing protein n=1 Tax=Exiguobacterium qingdaonense TaxID=2751251 RepID=UPI001BE95859|nr:DUF3221 domain-containing protein [Exiguobacterium qingdaonense]